MPVALPPRRTKPPPASRRESAPGTLETGLRIDPKPLERAEGETAGGIEVQEINGEVVRLDTEIVPPPKVPRQTTFKPLPAAPATDPSQAGEGREWGRTSRHSLKWIIGSCLGITAIVVFSLMMLPSINQPNQSRPRPGQIGLVIEPERIPVEAEDLGAWLGRRTEAVELFAKFNRAADAVELIPLVRDSAEVGDLIVRHHRPPQLPAGWSPPADSEWSAYRSGDRTIGILEGTYPDFTKFRTYMVDEGDGLRIDWKASSGFGTATFDELSAGTGDPSEIRGRLSPSGYYNHLFEESHFQSYQLASPDNMESVWCYAPRDSAAGASLAELFFEGEIIKPEKSWSKVTLRLVRGPEGSAPNQWLVEELLHSEWANP